MNVSIHPCTDSVKSFDQVNPLVLVIVRTGRSLAPLNGFKIVFCEHVKALIIQVLNQCAVIFKEEIHKFPSDLKTFISQVCWLAVCFLFVSFFKADAPGVNSIIKKRSGVNDREGLVFWF